jgi:hypothetical protein
MRPPLIGSEINDNHLSFLVFLDEIGGIADDFQHPPFFLSVLLQSSLNKIELGNLPDGSVPEFSNQVSHMGGLFLRRWKMHLQGQINDLSWGLLPPILQGGISKTIDDIGFINSLCNVWRKLHPFQKILKHNPAAAQFETEPTGNRPWIDLSIFEFLEISLMVVEPEPALKRIREVTDHILFGDGDLGPKDRHGACKENLSHAQCPGTNGGAHDAVKIIVGDDLFENHR